MPGVVRLVRAGLMKIRGGGESAELGLYIPTRKEYLLDQGYIKDASLSLEDPEACRGRVRGVRRYDRANGGTDYSSTVSQPGAQPASKGSQAA